VKDEYKKLREEVKNATEEVAMRRHTQSVKQAAPSLDHTQQFQRDGVRQMLSEGGRSKLFS
jgi:hypothetical protein